MTETRAVCNKITSCSDGHKLSIYCQECNRLLCDECCIREHNVPLEGHNFEKIHELITREAAEVEILKAQLDKSSEKARALAEVNNAQQLLNVIHRESMILLQQQRDTKRFLKPNAETIEALIANRNLRSRLKELIEKKETSMESAAHIPEPDLLAAIVETATLLKKESEGVSIFFDTFKSSQSFKSTY